MLAVLLGFVSKTGNVGIGASSLFCYALGQGLPILTLGLFAGLITQLPQARGASQWLSKLSGLLFLLIGVYLLTQAFGFI